MDVEGLVSHSHVVTITSNNPPDAVNDSYTTPFNTPLTDNVITNDSDPDGDNIIVNTTPITNVSNGTLVLNANGTFTYTPNSGYTGLDTFVYEICDDGNTIGMRSGNCSYCSSGCRQ